MLIVQPLTALQNEADQLCDAVGTKHHGNAASCNHRKKKAGRDGVLHGTALRSAPPVRKG